MLIDFPDLMLNTRSTSISSSSATHPLH